MKGEGKASVNATHLKPASWIPLTVLKNIRVFIMSHSQDGAKAESGLAVAVFIYLALAELGNITSDEELLLWCMLPVTWKCRKGKKPERTCPAPAGERA